MDIMNAITDSIDTKNGIGSMINNVRINNVNWQNEGRLPGPCCVKFCNVEKKW